MAVFRFLMLLLLVVAGTSFVLYAFTGHARYRKVGLRVLTTAIAAGFVFFAVLIAQRIA